MHVTRRTLLTAAAGAAALMPAHPALAVPPPPGPPLPYTGTAPAGEEPCFLPATVQLELLRRRRISAVELTRAHLARIRRINPAINAFVYLLPDEQVYAAALEADRRYRARTNRPLEGLLLAVKDLFDYVKDVPNTFGSRPIHQLGFTAPFTSIYIQRLIDAGAIVVGKTNTAELGHKGTTDNLVFGPTRTPFDLDYNAGGSSGGAAAAVAAFLVPLAQGSDAGGSVRIPAALCGVVGLKPTQGRIPQDAPPLPHTPMLTPGPITRTVTDTALLMNVMGGPSPVDMFSLLDTPHSYTAGLSGRLRGVKVAYSPDLDLFPVDPAVAATVPAGLAALRAAGATVTTVRLGLDQIQLHPLRSPAGRPVTQNDLSALWVMLQSALYAHGRDLFLVEGAPVDLLDPGVIDQLSPDLVDMIRRGEETSAVEYQHAAFLRVAVNTSLERTFAGYDLIACPTLAVPSVSNGPTGYTVGPTSINGVGVNPLIGWALTYLTNFTGHPSLTVPAGMAGRFPIGMQLIGRRGADAALLNAGYAVERHRPWYTDLPRH